MKDDVHVYDYLKNDVGEKLADRIRNVTRTFSRVVDLGCGRGYVSKHITSDIVEQLIMCDNSPLVLNQAQLPQEGVEVQKMIVDEENLPFEPDSIDLVLSSLSLHWVNNLPGTFSQIYSCLKNDGVFMATMFGSDTLFELRCSLQLAQVEREGGISQHVSPFTKAADIGSLLSAAGFRMLTIDVDELIIGYPSMFELMWDLQGMGENNATWNRCPHLHKDTMLAASVIYENMYGEEDKIPATFQIIHFVGWKPDPSQPKPIPRGSGKISLKDLSRLDEILKERGYEEPKK